MDIYAKKPTVKRFNRKSTYAGRDVKRTTVIRRSRPMEKGKKMKPIKAMKKGMVMKRA